MSTHEPDDVDGEWVRRYREASDSEAVMPSPATREAILAEGRRVAALRAANPTTHAFDPKHPAANQSRWKVAAAGTVGGALLAMVLMFPHTGAPPSPVLAESARPKSHDIPAAAPAAQAARTAPAASVPPAMAGVRSALTNDSLLANVDSGNLARVRASLDAGGNPEQRDALGRTPLLLAVIAHREDLVELLLAHHADPNAADQAGQTPLQRARLEYQSNIAGLLERAGAR